MLTLGVALTGIEEVANQITFLNGIAVEELRGCGITGYPLQDGFHEPVDL